MYISDQKALVLLMLCKLMETQKYIDLFSQNAYALVDSRTINHLLSRKAKVGKDTTTGPG